MAICSGSIFPRNFEISPIIAEIPLCFTLRYSIDLYSELEIPFLLDEELESELSRLRGRVPLKMPVKVGLLLPDP